MEDSLSECKSYLSEIPEMVLSQSCRLIQANNLDNSQIMMSEQGFSQDYRGLAELFGFQYNLIKKFVEFEDPTMKILQSWETRPDATLGTHIAYLEVMGQHDIIEKFMPSLKNDVAEYQETPIQVDEENDVAEYQENPVPVAQENDVAEYQETPIQVDEENDVAEYQENPVPVAQENNVAEYQETPIQVDEENDVAEYQENPVQVAEENDAAEYQETPIHVHEEKNLLDQSVGSVANNQKNPVQVDEVSSGLRNRALTRDDLIDRVCTQYDALLAHDEDDSMEAFKIAQNLESPKVGIKLLIPARDLLAGNFEFETLLELMMNRCRHILMILTPNFVRNRTLEFQVNFAVKLGVERNERILIPVIAKPCGIPPVLRNMTPINLTTKYSESWLYENLVNSILPKGRAPFSLPPLERCPLNIMNTIPNSISTGLEDVY